MCSCLQSKDVQPPPRRAAVISQDASSTLSLRILQLPPRGMASALPDEPSFLFITLKHFRSGSGVAQIFLQAALTWRLGKSERANAATAWRMIRASLPRSVL